MKIAVTGSKGFIGRRLVAALRSQGDTVIELDLPEFDMTVLREGAPVFSELLSGVEVLYHLAVMNLEHCKKDSPGCINNNVCGTLNVLEQAKEAGIRRVIYSSASSVYGSTFGKLVKEDFPTNPLTLYGVTKLAAEKIVQLYQDDRLITGIFRFSNVYGPGQVNGIIPNVIRSLISGDKIEITGSGRQTRDFVYVDDVVNILIKASKHPLWHFVVNLGSGQPVSINEVVRLTSIKLDRTPHIHHVPLVSDRNAYCADLTLLRKVYEQYKFVTFDEGLEMTVNYWKQCGGLRIVS